LLIRGGRAAVRRARARLPHRQRPAILMYHRVAAEPFDPWGLAVTPARFREQVRWLSRNRTVLRLSEFASLHRSGRLPDGAVAITMDDGYACNVEVAAPVLEQFGVPATIFVATALVSKVKPFWWDELEEIILEHDSGALTLEGEPIEIGEPHPRDRMWRPGQPARTPRQSAFLQIHTQLARKSPAELADAMSGLRREASVRQSIPPFKKPMTPAQLRAAPAVIEFGSHTLTHPWLPSLNAEQQSHEICDSRERCRALTGKMPRSFAYPFGAADARSEALAERAGYECACTTDEFAVSPGSRSFALPRIGVGNWSAARLRRALADIRGIEEGLNGGRAADEGSSSVR
jgi:peptidoglycan/xylan/chitin deacetylase (PgdA/CDA1 family)